MMNIDLITRDELINLLNHDEGIRQIIRTICFNNNNSAAQNSELEEYKNKIRELEKLNQQANDKIKELEKSNSVYEASQKNIAEDYERQIITLKQEYSECSEISELWKDFGQIEIGQKEFVTQLCGSNNIYALISLGRDYSKLKQLATAVKNYAVNDREYGSDYTTLAWYNRYLKYSVILYNNTNTSGNKLEPISVEISSEFDSSRSDKTVCSGYGEISEILVNGYRRSDNEILLLPVVKTK